VVKRAYRCAGCGLELAHVDMAPNGTVRGVFGWLMDRGAVISERYRITGVLGKGGFGVTYLGFDLTLQVQVAVVNLRQYGAISMAA
jgi:serine/threonine-protein kinase